MQERLYGFPVLMKAGLGNMLVPWARCVVWCHDHDARMIAPYWGKLRVGPFLRRERDKRQYQRLFQDGEAIGGFERLRLLATAKSVEVADWQASNAGGRRSATVVRFRGMEGVEALHGRHAEIATALRRITRPGHLPRERKDKFIGIHVRMGDFQPATPEELKDGTHCRRLPVEWYGDTLAALRAAIGSPIPAVVFGDGSDTQLASLLAQHAVTRSESRSAITDLLALSESAVIIASGSAFSMWSSFLGGAPTVWYPGQCFSMRGGARVAAQDVEWEPGMFLDPAFVGAAAARSGASHAARARTA